MSSQFSTTQQNTTQRSTMMMSINNDVSPLSTLNPFYYHFNLHPRQYVAPYTETPITSIDGDINKEVWSSVPWSNTFDDIRGPEDVPSQNDRPDSKCNTKFKMIWDDNYLYIIAMIESDFEVRATFTERNSPIYQQDSDFEVFIDPLGSCHDYKELEINALNTVWNLMLDKPYWDGGVEHSGRIAKPGDQRYYDVKYQRTAVQIVDGNINTHDENTKDGLQRNVWVVEMALSHRDIWNHIIAHSSSPNTSDGNVEQRSVIPNIGDRWRINFSRVEKKGDINWTWQPQRVWDAKLCKHVGKVDMHLPDAWGYVQFGPSSMNSDSDNATNIIQKPGEDIHNQKDPLWPFKLAVANIYYAQRQYKEIHGKFACNVNELELLTDSQIFRPFDPKSMALFTTENNYHFKVCNSEGTCVSINQDRLIRIEAMNNAAHQTNIKFQR